MQHGFRSLSRISLVLALTALAACGGDASGPTTPTVARVTVEPTSATVWVGATTQLSATARDAGGSALSGHSIAWSSSNSQLATVSASGLVTGVAAGGPVSIIATCEGKSGSAQVTVDATVATVSVTPASSELVPGSTVQLYAITRDDQGHTLTDRAVSWKSSAESVATVSSSGLVTGVAPEVPVTITATSEGKSGSAQVTVLGPVVSVTVAPDSLRIPVGAEEQLVASLRDAYGNVLIRSVTWASSDPPIARASSSGLLQALAAGGPVTITATSEGVSGSARVSVTPVLPLALASGTAMLDGKLYQPGDGVPHSTVVLLSAIRREMAENADIAAGVVAEGWNALMFDFSGSFGSTGEFSYDNALMDAANVVAILRSPTVPAAWGIDASRLVLLGRGEGGWFALMGAARDGAIACVGALSPMDIGMYGRAMANDSAAKAVMLQIIQNATQGPDPALRIGTTPEEMVEDMIVRADEYDLGPKMASVADRPVLLVGAAADQQYPFYEQARLVDALNAAGATKLSTGMIDDEHHFSGHRPELVQQVRDWLRIGCGN